MEVVEVLRATRLVLEQLRVRPTILVRRESPAHLDLPASIALYGVAGGTIRLDSLATDLPRQPRLDSQGSLSFRFGGELHVEGDVSGDYRGDVPITVDYL